MVDIAASAECLTSSHNAWPGPLCSLSLTHRHAAGQMRGSPQRHPSIVRQLRDLDQSLDSWRWDGRLTERMSRPVAARPARSCHEPRLCRATTRLPKRLTASRLTRWISSALPTFAAEF